MWLIQPEFWRRETLPNHLVVVGGGVIGCEFACMHASVGIQVTVWRLWRKFARIWMPKSLSLREGLSKKGVAFKLGAKVESISSDKVSYSDESGSNELEADLVLVATGRRPNTKNLGLEELGLDIDDRGGVRVDDRGATNIPSLWAAGGVTGQAWLAHAASRMAEVVVNNMTGRKDQMRYDSYACGGLHQSGCGRGLDKEEAEDRGIKVKVGRIPMAINARYIAENPDETGFCKVVP